MIVHFTARSAATLWQMLCNPEAHWKQADWYRGEDPTAENELARLHQFADLKLAKTEGTAKLFAGGVFSLRKDLVLRAEKLIDHYREKCKKGLGGVLPIQFAELTDGLKGNKPNFNNEQEDEDDDAEALQRLRAEYGAATEAGGVVRGVLDEG